ncbi:hypothetical protein VB779_12290 [Haloarculaceae archaeon H-GB11]|nr:hypothetical protein [Haloarculaceae archaeon H-GB11]
MVADARRWLTGLLGATLAVVLAVGVLRLTGPLLGVAVRFVLVPLVVVAAVVTVGLVYRTANRPPASAYTRRTHGVASRSGSDAVQLSATRKCGACGDDSGSGVRRLDRTEVVLAGVPLVLLGEDESVRCDVCTDPVGAAEMGACIDAELE